MATTTMSSLVLNCIQTLNTVKKEQYYEYNIFFIPLANSLMFHYCSKYKCYHFYKRNEDEFNENAELFNIFRKVIKTQSSFKKLLRMWRQSKFEIVNETDMCLNILNKKNKYTICLKSENKKYFFSIFDLKKIIYNCLNQNVFLFSEPQPIRNPFSNTEFTQTDLYNIYFFMKYLNVEIHELFNQFFKVNFNLYNFKNTKKDLLRIEAINDKVNSYDDDILETEIYTMLANYNEFANEKNKYVLNDDFPQHVLVEAMRPFLRIYWKGLFCYNQEESSYYLKEYLNRLYFFKQLNPKFGRVYYKTNGNKINTKTYHTDYIPFLYNFTSNTPLIDILAIFDEEKEETNCGVMV